MYVLFYPIHLQFLALKAQILHYLCLYLEDNYMCVMCVLICDSLSLSHPTQAHTNTHTLIMFLVLPAAWLPVCFFTVTCRCEKLVNCQQSLRTTARERDAKSCSLSQIQTASARASYDERRAHPSHTQRPYIIQDN